MHIKKRSLLSQCLAFACYGLMVSYSHAANDASEQANIDANFANILQKVEAYQDKKQLMQQRQSIAQLNIQQSRLWKNPSLNIQQTGFSTDQEREFNIGISQPLDVFGQRKASQNIARVTDQQIQLKEQLWNAQSQLIVKFAWSQALLSKAESDLYAAQFKLSQSNLDSAKKRYQAGSIALVDYERAQIETLDNQRLYRQAEINHQTAVRQLSNLWGETTSKLQDSSSNEIWPKGSDQQVRHYIAEAWLEKLYALNLIQSKQQIDRLRVQSKPNPTLNMGMRQTNSPNENKESALVLGVDIPLNIFDRQQYKIPIAEKQQMMVNQQQQRELKQQILDIANRMNELKGLRNQFESSQAQIKLSETIQTRVLQGFQAGKFSITDVQQSTLQLQNLRLSQLQVLKQAWQSALSAEALSLGTSYEVISQSDAYTQLNQDAISITQSYVNGLGE